MGDYTGPMPRILDHLALPTPLAFEQGVAEVDLDFSRIDAWTRMPDFVGVTVTSFEGMLREIDHLEHAGWSLFECLVWS